MTLTFEPDRDSVKGTLNTLVKTHLDQTLGYFTDTDTHARWDDCSP